MNELEAILSKGIALYFEADANGLAILRSEDGNLLWYLNLTPPDLSDD